MTTRFAVSLLAVAALGLGGCSAEVSTGKTVNTDKAEESIGASLSEQLGGTVTVTCPDDVEAKKGDTFTCDAKGSDGRTGTVNVTQKDDDGNISWKLG
ncbi:DUF4333 domain-containing protein [Conexibacter sp. W3-3-2]|uniref:DUF4333 domain-containing protein n=1 Tax=Paraconexibacter algicola TaxID=2133960 RepID=A0A2T4UIR1_9ACTN|nr:MULTISPECIES: DUF4333 domain-containing protein [Solirubrobacterales]MTD45426.1 DUF4333 domain-containing protein [Conexibacter sp. W3-3-2]PTL59118.1 DUF4333 domain-containing protein [Paraconexibacter algicola]